MYLRRSSSGWVVQAPAKLNLFFEVLGKRSDGYHEIETFVTPIDWYDTLCFTPRDEGPIGFSCRRMGGSLGTDFAVQEVPEGTENLVVRAVELLRRRAGVEWGARVRLVKRIPIAAGLGGGSSDAAAALAVANVSWQLGWSCSDLANLGAELGSDVPLFFAQGPVVCRGRGERVEPIAAVGNIHFVVVRPPAGLATAAVYKVCRPAERAKSVEPFRQAFQRGDLRQVGRLLFNRLEAAAEGLSPWIGRLRAEFARLDVLGHQMSGSGTCYFGLCRHARHARRVAHRLQAKRIGIAFAVRTTRF
jgi:4-diphosphocytidyl-2-C-methyl-D-erythritol kinase